MKPKLIILNGALGVGKSTLAEKYAAEHPLTLKLDIDEVRRWISHFREEKEISGPLAKKISGEMARVHLQAGYDVIISQIFTQSEPLENLENIARGCGANFYEFLLTTSKEDSIRRFIERGKAEGYPDGFRPGGLVTLGGKEKKLEQMYDDMMLLISKRQNIKSIESIEGDIEDTYSKLLEKLDSHASAERQKAG
ncbi:MAG: AAA family ATPase [Candidatus Woesebacteria bacterium]